MEANELQLGIQDVHYIYPSADRQMLMTFRHYYGQNNLLEILDLKTQEVVFGSDASEDTAKIICSLSPGWGLYELADFSPDNKSFVVYLSCQIYLGRCGEEQLKTIDLRGKIAAIKWIKFLDNQTLIFITGDELIKYDLTKNKMEKHQLPTSHYIPNEVFINRLDRKVFLCSWRQQMGQRAVINIFSFDINVCRWSTDHTFEFKSLVEKEYENDFVIKYESAHESIIFDMSYYMEGHYSISRNLPYKITMKVFGQISTGPNVKELEKYYLFSSEDKIYTHIKNSIYEIDIKDTKQVIMAKLVANGFCEESEWSKFLTKGLYDPRLLLIIAGFVL